MDYSLNVVFERFYALVFVVLIGINISLHTNEDM